MPDVSIPDDNLNHLYPNFRALVELTLAQANTESAGKFAGFDRWILFEGYRSQARQTWLYAQGRSRPGQIVTKMQTPKRHGVGLAADIVWTDKAGRPHWDGPDALWQELGHAARTQGLVSGVDWAKFRDAPHIETKLSTYLLWLLPAKQWLKAIGLSTP